MKTAVGFISLVLAAAAAAPGVSVAAVTTIGPPTLTMGTENSIFEGTFIQYAGAAPAAEYVSPIEGTIVTWRIASGSSSEFRLRVLRPTGGGNFTGVGTSATEMASPPLATFATNLPIKAGDVIAVDNEKGALMFTTGVPGAFPQVFEHALADGAPAAKPTPVPTGSGGGTDLKLQINADIQPTQKSGGTGGGGTGGNGSGTGGSGGGTQAAAPTLGALKVSPIALSAGSSGRAGKGKPKPGATISYTDSQAATTTFTVLQRQPGRKNSQGVCAKPPRKPHGKPCTRTVRIGSFTQTDRAGTNSFHFSGRVNGHRLKPGGYQLQAIARSTTGLTSKPLTASFRVKT